MTFGSLLSSHFGTHKTPLHDRGEHLSYPPPWKGHSKGGGKGTQSSLSALTLLAFLFFLNILQTCLKDQLAAQSPLIIMMTTQTTTTTEGGRHRREASNMKVKGDSAEIKRVPKNISEIKYANMTRKFNVNSHEYSLQTLEENNIINRKKRHDVKSLKRGYKIKSFNFSPWLQSIFCCNILFCSNAMESSIRCH